MFLKTSMKFIICISLIVIFLFASFSSSSFALDIAVPITHSPSLILLDANSGKVLYSKNIDEKRYPASLTKVMTAIIVLEKCELTDIATVSKNVTTSIPSGYVTANLKEGEKLTVEQLLYLLMIASANDAAIVLAEHVSRKCGKFFSINE